MNRNNNKQQHKEKRKLEQTTNNEKTGQCVHYPRFLFAWLEFLLVVKVVVEPVPHFSGRANVTQQQKANSANVPARRKQNNDNQTHNERMDSLRKKQSTPHTNSRREANEQNTHATEKRELQALQAFAEKRTYGESRWSMSL